MGGAGKKLPGHGAHVKKKSPAAQSSDGGHGRPPHPLRLCPGQVFWSRAGRKCRGFMVIGNDEGGSVAMKRLDDTNDRVRISSARLLATDEDAQGKHYSFVKWSPRHYKTWAYVQAMEPSQAMLVLPEWHPRREVRLPTRLLSLTSQHEGSWVRVMADLSQPSAGALNLRVLDACEDPGALVPRPPPAAGPEPCKALPVLGAGCGDIVLESAATLKARGARWVIFLRERPTELREGSRVYVPRPEGSLIAGYVHLISSEISPNGASLYCDPTMSLLDCRIEVEGQRELVRWRWRWWPRRLEASEHQQALEGYPYLPDYHDPAYVWTHRAALVEHFAE